MGAPLHALNWHWSLSVGFDQAWTLPVTCLRVRKLYWRDNVWKSLDHDAHGWILSAQGGMAPSVRSSWLSVMDHFRRMPPQIACGCVSVRRRSNSFGHRKMYEAAARN